MEAKLSFVPRWFGGMLVSVMVRDWSDHVEGREIRHGRVGEMRCSGTKIGSVGSGDVGGDGGGGGISQLQHKDRQRYSQPRPEFPLQSRR